MGRPSSFTPEAGGAICEAIEGGATIREITAREDMPAWPTIRRWLRDNEAFRTRYAHAREVSAAAFEERLLAEVATAVDSDSASAARVRIDAIKWIMSKRAPKVYGDKTQVDAKVDAVISVVTGVPRAG
jgi:hypothetical protein